MFDILELELILFNFEYFFEPNNHFVTVMESRTTPFIVNLANFLCFMVECSF